MGFGDSGKKAFFARRYRRGGPPVGPSPNGASLFEHSAMVSAGLPAFQVVRYKMRAAPSQQSRHCR